MPVLLFRLPSHPLILYYIPMIRNIRAFSILALACGCTVKDRGENSAICGITMLASATRIIDEVTDPLSAITDAPDELRGGVVPARVVGYGTSPALAGTAEDGSILVQFSGEGFPERPGFGAALVDDSSEIFRGILIWDKQPPPDDYPTLGSIASPNTVIPLIGVLVHWGSVNSERCPLFAQIDSTIP